MRIQFDRIILFFAILFIGISSCKKDDGDDNFNPSVDQTAFLINTADIIYASYEDFNFQVNQLDAKIDSFAVLTNFANLNSAKSALRSAYKAWQKVNFYEFGPAENVSLKSSLNIHPTDTSKIENNISSGNYDLSVLSNKTAKGFPALDYLLNAKLDSINLKAFKNNSSRMEYLQAIMDDIKTKSNQVFNEWGTYKSFFSNNKGTDVGSSTGMLVNSLNQHYERYFRDNKIGIPLGVRSSGIQRLEMVEAYYGQYSTELAVENFEAMRDLYNGVDQNGKEGYGLDDYLSASNASQLNTNIQSQMQDIALKLKALSDPLTEQIANQPNQVREVYDEIQKLIILWKVDMPSRMGILITYQDNDGD